MPIIAVKASVLAQIRQLTALSARLHTAERVFYDRAWHVGYYSRFPLFVSQNVTIVTPLDILDSLHLKQRLLALKSAARGKLYLKITPLAAADFTEYARDSCHAADVEAKIIFACAASFAQKKVAKLNEISLETYASMSRQPNVLLPKGAQIRCFTRSDSASDAASYILDNNYAYIAYSTKNDVLPKGTLEAIGHKAIHDGALGVWYRTTAKNPVLDPGFAVLYNEFYYGL